MKLNVYRVVEDYTNDEGKKESKDLAGEIEASTREEAIEKFKNMFLTEDRDLEYDPSEGCVLILIDHGEENVFTSWVMYV